MFPPRKPAGRRRAVPQAPEAIPVRENRNDQRPAQYPEAPILAAETLRNASAPPAPAKGEERGSVFWRVCGGTVLSIVALVAVTLYQQLTAGVNELRTTVAAINTDLRKDLTQLGQGNADLVKKDEFNGRLTSVWNSIKELQSLSGTVGSLKERALVRDQQDKTDAESKEQMRKEVQTLEAAVTVLKERLTVREQEAQHEQARRELVQELQQLRERLANIEGRQAAATPARGAGHAE
jgi:hypothetical protein